MIKLMDLIWVALNISLFVEELTRLSKKAKPTRSCDKYHKCFENVCTVDFAITEWIDEYASSDFRSSRSLYGAHDARGSHVLEDPV
ncbi:hypothetical protein DPMN_016081 [Dreissena polymorpha]|uniref:Uncharacterized protein n=1 Tax=Dreissena polymorpha TaxID=45954 RepID=A0A9D4NCS3_DREPO|nr:hypothetical protein DPMN_016081 [Dreissena polymorpha]